MSIAIFTSCLEFILSLKGQKVNRDHLQCTLELATFPLPNRGDVLTAESLKEVLNTIAENSREFDDDTRSISLLMQVAMHIGIC